MLIVRPSVISNVITSLLLLSFVGTFFHMVLDLSRCANALMLCYRLTPANPILLNCSQISLVLIIRPFTLSDRRRIDIIRLGHFGWRRKDRPPCVYSPIHYSSADVRPSAQNLKSRFEFHSFSSFSIEPGRFYFWADIFKPIVTEKTGRS